MYKTNASKECDICQDWYLLDKKFKNEPCLCNGSHDLMQKVINFNDVTFVSVKGIDYIIHKKSRNVILTRAKDYQKKW